MAGNPTTPLSKIQRMPSYTPGGTRFHEEKMLVTVRVRPLNRREQALYDLIAWDFIDDKIIVPKNVNQERPSTTYTFDKVFSPSCSSQEVYDEGAKNVALSALNGINATIFAYGQTGSGKTFTMRGITENVIRDIYDYIRSTSEREFVLKLSALEIYNETVVDLLNRESGPLRLWDDPEKGTIIEKLNEEVVGDSQHLKHLIGICEAQRQVGETALNDKSSRSHQIIRLTIESTLRENSGPMKSFIATLNLVDLAGSERASQTKVVGTRLVEGSHINRSLLTLTTVIRKLSAGKKNSHIPYRDSKLTRILQSSLGGNARTAIICTMSPALSHIEQTRNTLLFATSAKEVTNTARVNMVVAEKRLVKELQKEVARLEAELHSPNPSSATCLKTLLEEKELKIQQMEKEMRELKRQRDLAQSQLELERKTHKVLKQDGPSSHVVKSLSFPNEPPSVKRSSLVRVNNTLRQSVTSLDPSTLVHEIRKLEVRQRQLGEEANRALEVLHKEVASHRLGSHDAAETIAKLLSEIKEMQMASSVSEDIVIRDNANLKDEISRLNMQGTTIESLEKKLENVQKSIDMLVSSFPSNEDTPESRNHQKSKKMLPFSLNNNGNMPNLIRSPCSTKWKAIDLDQENKVPEITPSADNSYSTPQKSNEVKNSISSRECTPAPRKSNSVNVKKMQRLFKNAAEENIRSIRAYVTELKERVAKLQYQKQLLVCQVLELETNESGSNNNDDGESVQPPMSWDMIFNDQRKQIVMLWHLCHVSIIHRTQFHLLFKGDPADQIYMEVELRRLTWLEQHLSELGNASPALLGDEPAVSVASSIRALKQEREYLAKRVTTRLTNEEREMLYIKWDIPQVGKQRRQQLVNKLWTDPYDMEHVRQSAEIVAKLVGFCESGEHVSREMFELNFKSPCDKKSWMGWNLISNLLHL